MMVFFEFIGLLNKICRNAGGGLGKRLITSNHRYSGNIRYFSDVNPGVLLTIPDKTFSITDGTFLITVFIQIGRQQNFTLIYRHD